MRVRKYKKNTLILVRWLDTVQDPKWCSEDEAGARPDADCITVGFYLKHDKEFIYLSATISRTERDKTTIPIGCITDIIKISIADIGVLRKLPKP